MKKDINSKESTREDRTEKNINKKSNTKVIALVIAGACVLAASGYAAGKILSKNNNDKDLVQFEDGRKIGMNVAKKGEFDREGERPDAVGRIKSIDGNQIVIEQFETPEKTEGRGRNGMSKGDNATSPQERPKPTISGEETITLASSTSYVQGPQRGSGRRSVGAKNVKLEEISKSALKEGDIISVWFSEGNIVARVMIR